MKLSEIFNQLSYGELSQIYLGNGEAGEINKANYPKVLAHINLGIAALYKRFPLKQGRKVFVCEPGKSSYLLDTSEVQKVERVYTDAKWELSLNDESDPHSCFTPSTHVLVVPESVSAWTHDYPDYLKTSTLEVVYRANHPVITTDTLDFYDVEEIEVELPYSHLEPLLYFVASRVNNPIGTTNEFHVGNNYAAKYEAACQQLEIMNLRVDQGSQNTRLERNGWV